MTSISSAMSPSTKTADSQGARRQREEAGLPEPIQRRGSRGLEALLDRYMNTGIYEIEKTDILKLDPFAKLGKPARIAGYFGGRDGYMKAVRNCHKPCMRFNLKCGGKSVSELQRKVYVTRKDNVITIEAMNHPRCVTDFAWEMIHAQKAGYSDIQIV